MSKHEIGVLTATEAVRIYYLLTRDFDTGPDEGWDGPREKAFRRAYQALADCVVRNISDIAAALRYASDPKNEGDPLALELARRAEQCARRLARAKAPAVAAAA